MLYAATFNLKCHFVTRLNISYPLFMQTTSTGRESMWEVYDNTKPQLFLYKMKKTAEVHCMVGFNKAKDESFNATNMYKKQVCGFVYIHMYINILNICSVDSKFLKGKVNKQI